MRRALSTGVPSSGTRGIATAAGIAVVVFLVWVVVRVTAHGAGVPAGRFARGDARHAPVAASSSRESSIADLGAGAATASPAASPPGSDDGRAPRAPGALAASLEGTSVDGAFEVDAQGHAVFGASLVRLFDYLRSAEGEASDVDIRAYLEELAADVLPPEEVARVLGYYDRYLSHVDDVQAAFAAGEGPVDPEVALDRVHAMRVEAFGADDAERAFGADERLARAILAKQQIESDPTLDAAERDARLAELEADLPEDTAARWREARAITTLRGQTAELRAEGADEARVEALRVAAVGPEAAERLTRVDEARDRWASRVAAYRAELAAEGASSASRIEALRRAHFDGPELARIAALDRIELGLEPHE